MGSALSNRILFFDERGQLDPGYGEGGIVDLPCGGDANAIDWSTVRANGFEGIAVVDGAPSASGGLEVYVAMQRALTTEGQNTRIGEYDVDTGAWSWYFYPLDANPGGPQGSTFLSELIHVGGDTFAVVERDQGWAGEAGNKTIRTVALSSGTPNDSADPMDKALACDLLEHPSARRTRPSCTRPRASWSTSKRWLRDAGAANRDQRAMSFIAALELDPVPASRERDGESH
ncbi:esterase-like activity of phytase family protein [Sorangium sp. So ce1000]|uniref:esterase-like activity of phytase family protein n=1 Tax=Sorangium sp. So ce1000 TaxID=3133325 RepID=UPI003F629ACA